MIKLNKRERTIAIAMMAVIFIWGFMNTSKSARPKPKKSNIQPRRTRRVNRKKRGKKEEKVDIDNIIVQVQLKSTEVSVDALKDPFKRIVQEENVQAPVDNSSDLVFYGVVWEEEEPVVLINEQILKKGDNILGCTVDQIFKSEVILTKGSEKIILKLFEDEETEQE